MATAEITSLWLLFKKDGLLFKKDILLVDKLVGIEKWIGRRHFYYLCSQLIYLILKYRLLFVTSVIN